MVKDAADWNQCQELPHPFEATLHQRSLPDNSPNVLQELADETETDHWMIQGDPVKFHRERRMVQLDRAVFGYRSLLG